jgi:hypothetical protein
MRVSSLVSALVVAYLAFVCNEVVATIVLSPFRAVTAHGLLLVEALLLAAAVSVWWLRGRPGWPLARARTAAREVARSPLTIAFLGVAAAILGYEFLLVVSVPPNNYDSLTYHLVRVAAWKQHGGLFWIPFAPNSRMNEFQPLAEQQILFLFAAFGKPWLFALPQYLAEWAALVAVYGASRRLGFDARVAACTAALLATFALLELESVTAQNDLVAASFPVVAVYLLLGSARSELLLAGAAAGIGVGAKLTTVLVWPTLALLMLARGRRAAGIAVVGACTGFVVTGAWGYVLNVVHSGRFLGRGFGGNTNSSISLSGAPTTSLHVVYRLFDLSGFSFELIDGLAAVGIVASVTFGLHGYYRGGLGRAGLQAAAVGVPLLTPLAIVGAGPAFLFLSRQVGVHIHDSFENGVNRRANEDYSGFGPVGWLTLLGLPLMSVVLYSVRRLDRRHVVLALTLPIFVLLLGALSTYNPFLMRFLLVPVVLTAPLFGIVLRNRRAASALLVVGAVAALVTFRYDRTKPFNAHPWRFTQINALGYISDSAVAPADAAYERLVPPDACVGAILGSDEPSYVLWGHDLRRRVYFLPSIGSLVEAYRHSLSYVVISVASNAASADQFTQAGWKVEDLGTYWLLASAPQKAASTC